MNNNTDQVPEEFKQLAEDFGKNGFITPLFDEEIMAEKMIYFIENPEQIVSMGNESYSNAQKNFDVNKIIGK